MRRENYDTFISGSCLLDLSKTGLRNLYAGRQQATINRRSGRFNDALVSVINHAYSLLLSIVSLQILDSTRKRVDIYYIRHKNSILLLALLSGTVVQFYFSQSQDYNRDNSCLLLSR
jgi:hypothetical protein